MTDITSCFSSLAEMQASHDEMLDRREGLPEGDEAAASFWPEVATFVRRGVATGAVLDASRDRRAGQSILDYWANALYRAGQPAPEARLADLDPSLAPELPDEPCPYRGLAAFGEGDREFFFGRERLLNEMVERLRDGERLLAVVGSSGSGKSSVVLAGLLPRLKGGALPGSEGWRYATIVPGSQPLASLARATVEVPTGQAAAGLDVGQAARLLFAAEGFARDPGHLAATQDETAAAPLVLAVDQFEELFTLCTDEDARAAFVGQLLGLTAAAGSGHRVILTMRTDFVDNVARLPELFPLFRDARVDVEALDINELRAAIEGPAARVGLKFEEGIVDNLISTILGERAGLPLLQFTLLKLWERRQRNRVTREVYREVGNPREALERSAEAFYNRLIPEEKETAKRILLRMVQPGEGREVTSNRIRRDEVFRAGEARDRVERVLDRLIGEARLVKLTEGETEADTQIEVAHEALVRNWPRLVGWLDEEREGLRRRRRLTAAAEQWQRLGKTSDALLRGALLAEAQEYGDLSGPEQEFIAASRDQVEAERRAEMERRVALAQTQAEARAAGRLRRLVFGLVAVLLLALAAMGFAFVQTRLVTGYSLAVQAQSFVRDRNLRLATLLALEARQLNRTQGERVLEDEIPIQVPFTPARSLTGHSDAVWSVAWRPDGRQLASGSRDNTIIVWDAETGAPVRTLAGHSAAVTSVAWRPDGRQLASGSWDNTIIVWDAETGAPVRTLAGHSAEVWSVAWRPDGRQLASGSSDNTIIVWDAETGAPVRTLAGHSAAVWSVAWRPDGRQLASGSSDNTIIVWDAETGAPVRTLAGHSAAVTSVAWRPDGRQLASGSSDNTIIVWDAETGAPVRTLAGHSAAVWSVAWRPDGRQLASGSRDNTIIVWDAETGAPVRTLAGHSAEVWSVAWRPDGRQLASGSRDNTIIVYPVVYWEPPCTWTRSNLTVDEWVRFRGRAVYQPTCPDYPSQSVPGIVDSLNRNPEYLFLTLQGWLLVVHAPLLLLAIVVLLIWGVFWLVRRFLRRRRARLWV